MVTCGKFSMPTVEEGLQLVDVEGAASGRVRLQHCFLFVWAPAAHRRLHCRPRRSTKQCAQGQMQRGAAIGPFSARLDGGCSCGAGAAAELLDGCRGVRGEWRCAGRGEALMCALREVLFEGLRTKPPDPGWYSHPGSA